MKSDFNYDMIKSDYELSGFDTFQSDELVYRLKEAVAHLNEIEKRILITYVELGSYSATARVYNVSSPTVKAYVSPIIEKIKKEIEKEIEL